MSWINETERFREELTKGYNWQKFVLLFLDLHGIKTEMPELEFRESIEKIPTFLNSKDMIANGQRIEVKSRTISFTSPNNFPYSTVLLDPPKKSDARKDVFAYIIVSRSTGAMIWLPMSSKEQWKVERKFDSVRKFWDDFYSVDKKLFKTMDSLINELRKI